MKNKITRTATVKRMKLKIKVLKKLVNKLYDTNAKHQAQCNDLVSETEKTCNDLVHTLRVEKQTLEIKLSNLRLEMQEYKRKKWYQFIER